MSRAEAIAFPCGADTLVGILHRPVAPSGIGVVVVVGGPQYRVGSHRQFLLLARVLAEAGHTVLRFDCRGMGDSEGAFPGFEEIGADIRAAIDTVVAADPAVRTVVLWGLCDAASAILFYAASDPRVGAIAIANPWTRTEAGLARTQIRHHYAERLADRAFWSRLLKGEVRIRSAVTGLLGVVRRAIAPAKEDAASTGDLPARMAQGLERFAGPVLLVMSGNDLTAREFDDVSAGSPRWRALLAAPRVLRCDLPESDHTFSTAVWRDTVAAATARWVATLT